jgi:hypothetical protein
MVVSRSEEVIRDERAIETVPRSVPVPRKASDPEHDPSKAVARSAIGNAETDRSKSCAPVGAEAVDPRADKGGSTC